MNYYYEYVYLDKRSQEEKKEKDSGDKLYP